MAPGSKAKKSSKSGKSGKKKGKAKKKNKKKLARLADKHALYEASVQGPEEDSKFFEKFYKKAIGRPATVFREDFCGTATLSSHWVQRRPHHVAIGVDLDGPTLDWGRRQHLEPMSEDERSRITLVQDNVLNVTSPKADIVCALNFSYGVFKTRAELGDYIRNAYESCAEDGLFFCDAWGGADTQIEYEEDREVDDFTYIWDQHSFDPVNYFTTCKIHFEFKDGSKLRNAFVYDWRMWTLPELRELFEEAGFQDVHVLWEGTDRKTNEGNGIFRRVTKGEADNAWIAYVVGRK